LEDDFDVERLVGGPGGGLEARGEATTMTISGNCIFMVERQFSLEMSSATTTSKEGRGVQCRRVAQVD
jgi:hypothetical protein